MAAIMTAVQPFVVHRVHNVAEPRNFVATAQCYGGTFQLFQVRLSEERDIQCRWVEDPTDLDEWERNIDENTRFLYGELPSNPGLGFFDIRAVADLAHSYNLPLIVDSTVATPALLRPICHGADIVVQSATKTLTSSGFGICGAIIARRGIVTNIDNDDLRNNFAIYVKYMPNRDHGPNLHPVQALMTLNDVRTLRSKVDMLSIKTMKVAEYLQTHPQVESVEYLGLPNHPLHDLASRYMWLVDAEHDEQYGKPINRYGHLMSFCVKGGPEASRNLDPPAAGRGRPQAGAHSAEPGASLCRRRAPRRHHRRPGSGPGVPQDVGRRGARLIGRASQPAFMNASISVWPGSTKTPAASASRSQNGRPLSSSTPLPA
jgi:O-acetylhomoserine/O-acetylserine sulfhydrylase-like pyridoxal-dependent enzyme